MNNPILQLVSAIVFPPGLALSIHRAFKPKVNAIYKPISSVPYINVAGIQVEKVPYTLQEIQ